MNEILANAHMRFSRFFWLLSTVLFSFRFGGADEAEQEHPPTCPVSFLDGGILRLALPVLDLINSDFPIKSES